MKRTIKRVNIDSNMLGYFKLRVIPLLHRRCTRDHFVTTIVTPFSNIRCAVSILVCKRRKLQTPIAHRAHRNF